jgi:thiol-disulfide isomerase/thioredoxin
VFASAGAHALVIVDWSAPWCGPCRAIRPLLDALAAEQPRVALVSINTEATPENAALAAEAAISAFPTFHAYRAGARVEEWRGANPAMLRAAMQRHAPPGSLVAAAAPAAAPAAMPVTAPAPPPPPPSAAQLAAAAGGPMAAAVASALGQLRASVPSLPDFAAAVRTLLTFVGNVVAHPSDARYRRVRTSNAAFAAKLGGVDGGTEAMRAFGFVPATDEASGESILLMSEAAATDAQLPAVKAMLEEALRAATAAAPQPAAASPFGMGSMDMGMGMPGGAAMPPGFEDLLAGGIGGAGGMGGFGGNPAAAANAMAAALASNPAARAAAASLAANPGALAAMMQTPQAQAAMRQLAGNNPSLNALMNNPALMQQMASAAAPQMAAMLQGGAQGGGGGMGGGMGGGFQMPPPATPAPGGFGGGFGGVDPAALAAALAGMGAGQQQQQQGGMSEDEALAEAIRRSLEDAS